MKKIFIVLSIVATSFIAVAATPEKNIPATVVNSFSSNFPDAENVSWQETGKFLVVSFTSEEKQFHAYYQFDGTFIVLAETITWKQLPKALKNGLEQIGLDANILAVYKMQSDDGIRYYCETQHKEGKEVYESRGSRWSTVQLKM